MEEFASRAHHDDLPDNVSVQATTCQWSEWSWSTCSSTCGNSVRTGTRAAETRAAVNSTTPSPCNGPNTTTQSCPLVCCPDAQGYCEWEPWAACDQPCGGGVHSRSRNVTIQGRVTVAYMTMACGNDWSDWSSCGDPLVACTLTNRTRNPWNDNGLTAPCPYRAEYQNCGDIYCEALGVNPLARFVNEGMTAFPMAQYPFSYQIFNFDRSSDSWGPQGRVDGPDPAFLFSKVGVQRSGLKVNVNWSCWGFWCDGPGNTSNTTTTAGPTSSRLLSWLR